METIVNSYHWNICKQLPWKQLKTVIMEMGHKKQLPWKQSMNKYFRSSNVQTMVSLFESWRKNCQNKLWNKNAVQTIFLLTLNFLIHWWDSGTISLLTTQTIMVIYTIWKHAFNGNRESMCMKYIVQKS